MTPIIALLKTLWGLVAHAVPIPTIVLLGAGVYFYTAHKDAIDDAVKAERQTILARAELETVKTELAASNMLAELRQKMLDTAQARRAAAEKATLDLNAQIRLEEEDDAKRQDELDRLKALPLDRCYADAPLLERLRNNRKGQ